MDIRIDVMADGQLLIYDQLENGKIGEPAYLKMMPVQGRPGSFQAIFDQLLIFSDKTEIEKHDSHFVLYSYAPVAQIRNAFIDHYNAVKAQKSGIVQPSPAQIHAVRK